MPRCWRHQQVLELRSSQQPRSWKKLNERAGLSTSAFIGTACSVTYKSAQQEVILRPCPPRTPSKRIWTRWLGTWINWIRVYPSRNFTLPSANLWICLKRRKGGSRSSHHPQIVHSHLLIGAWQQMWGIDNSRGKGRQKDHQLTVEPLRPIAVSNVAAVP